MSRVEVLTELQFFTDSEAIDTTFKEIRKITQTSLMKALHNIIV